MRVYDWNTASVSWTKRGSDIDGEIDGKQSGWSVSMSSDGNTVAIGAPQNNGVGSYAGHVRVYDWNTASVSWTKRGSDIDGEAANDYSGWSVSLSSNGNTLAIGAPNNSDAGSYAGHVRVYDWNAVSVSWAKRGSDIDGEAAGDQSGRSVSLSSDGNTVAIGAIYNSGNGSNTGHVRVYDWNTASVSWTKRGSNIDGEAPSELSGYSVSLSSDGNTVAIGAPYNADTSYNAGQVRVYEIEKLTTFLSNFIVPSIKIGNPPFTITAPTTNSDGSFSYISSNTSVATISGSTVTIVGPGSSTITATQAATNKHLSATIEASLIVDTRWRQHGLDIGGEAAGDQSGWSVSLSSDGNTVAIGAPNNSGAGSNAGHVRVYYWNTAITPNKWTQRGSDIIGEADSDLTGWSVSLSSDGNTVAFGAPYNNDAGSDAGQVRVYKWNGTLWTSRLLALDIDGEGAGDQSGYSVSLSSDGNTLVIGAPFNSGTGLHAGHARIYTFIKKNPSISSLNLPMLIGLHFRHVFTLTDPISHSTGSFSYTSTAYTKITGRTVTALSHNSLPTIITATQAETVDYTSGSTSRRLLFKSRDGRDICSIM